MATTKKRPKGLDGRQRDQSGQIRHKRSDTMVKTLRAEYGDHFLKGYRPAQTLGFVLKKEKAASLHDLLKHHKK